MQLIFANIATEDMSQIRIKKCETRSFICKVNLNFLLSSKPFDGDKALAVFVFSCNDSGHGFNKISNGRAKSGFEIVNFKGLWTFF